MLAKSNRLNLKKNFKRVASGHHLDTTYFRLFFLYGEASTPKAGIAVSTKHFKKAHERNRARRVTSAALEKVFVFLPTNINLIAIPKANLAEADTAEAYSDLEGGLKKARII